MVITLAAVDAELLTLPVIEAELELIRLWCAGYSVSVEGIAMNGSALATPREAMDFQLALARSEYLANAAAAARGTP